MMEKSTDFAVLVLRHGKWRLMVDDEGACWIEPPPDDRIGSGSLPTHEDLIQAIRAWECTKAAADLRSLDQKYEIAVIRFKMGCRDMSLKAHNQRRQRLGGPIRRLADRMHRWADERKVDRQVRQIIREVRGK